ncbi:hypothetical protein R5R35_014111 [Gryllus longicercus]
MTVFQKMKLSRKLWMMMFLAVCLVLVQYHLSTSWLLPGGAGAVAGGGGGGDGGAGAGAAGAGGPALREGAASGDTTLDALVRSAVERLQLHPALLASVGDRMLREVAVQLGHDILAAGCPEVKNLVALCPAAPATAPPPPPQQPPPTVLLPPPAPPTLYIITPTYRRPEQIPELTRMAQTLMHVRNIFWLVIEDANTTTRLVTELLNRTGIPYEHLNAPMPEEHKNRRGPKPRGVSNRNRGLAWLRANATTGVFYFADDDNTYDIQLFEEIRTTRKVAMWPVGLCTKFGLSTPIVANGTFKGFYDGWVAGRKFPVDMAGFAVSVEFLLKRPKASMPYKPGYEEDGFLKSLAPFEPSEIELKAQNCTKLLVWHTQTKSNAASAALDLTKYNNTNLVLLKQQIV